MLCVNVKAQMSKCITTARLVHDNANGFEGACWLGWFCCYRTLLLPSILTAEVFNMRQQQPTVSTESHKTNYVIKVPQINNGRKLLPSNCTVYWCTKCTFTWIKCNALSHHNCNCVEREYESHNDGQIELKFCIVERRANKLRCRHCIAIDLASPA